MLEMSFSARLRINTHVRYPGVPVELIVTLGARLREGCCDVDRDRVRGKLNAVPMGLVCCPLGHEVAVLFL